MKTALQIDITFEQILSMVRQLPRQQKIKLVLVPSVSGLLILRRMFKL